MPKTLKGEILSPYQVSQVDPFAAPGIILPGHNNINILLANLTDSPITVTKGQKIAFIHFTEAARLHKVSEIGSLDKFNIPVNTTVNFIGPNQLDHLPSDQKKQALELFDKYKDVFSSDTYDLGTAKGVTHYIDTGDSDPVRLQPVCRSLALEAVVNKEIQELLDKGLIKPSCSPWASPVLIVKKKDGINRVVIDYRRLNNVTKKDSYPLPCIDNTLDRLGGSKFFLAMDLASGYWQIELPESEQEKCAMITASGLYQPMCMPQGLCNAPATFQRAMDYILSDLKLSCVLVYLDNINVFSRTFNKHLKHLEEVFSRVVKKNMKLKPSKCHFFKSQVDYLRFVIDKNGLCPQDPKVEAINKMSTPANKRDVQVFLGMIGYYQRFVPNFATITGPLFNLLRKETTSFGAQPAKTPSPNSRASLQKHLSLHFPT